MNATECLPCVWGIVFILSAVSPAAAGGDPPEKELARTSLWTAGEDGCHTYRIPSLLATPQGTLLAICEARKQSARDSGDIALVMKRSTDGGRSWGSQQVIWADPGNTCGNPCPVVDASTGLIWMVMNHNLGGDSESAIINHKSKGTRTVWVTCSEDDGRTWAKPREITASVKKPGWTHFAAGPGVGIQIRAGQYAGRLVIPCDTIDDKGNYSLAVFSDDHGKTWMAGQTTPHGLNECQVVEREGGQLMLNMRNHRNARQTTRGVAISDDGGETWKDLVHDPLLVEPYCQASFIRYSWPEKDQPGRLLFSNPAARTRTNMTIRMSLDEGKTWAFSKSLGAAPAAYSCLARLPDSSVGLLYETGEKHPYERIDFVRFSLRWLLSPEPASQPDPPRQKKPRP